MNRILGIIGRVCVLRLLRKGNQSNAFKGLKSESVCDVDPQSWKTGKMYLQVQLTFMAQQPSNYTSRPVKNTHSVQGRGAAPSAAEPDVVCSDLWGGRAATAFTDKAGGGHLHSKAGLDSLRGVQVAAEDAVCDIICGEKAIQARVCAKLLLATTSSSSPVLKDPELALAPHLLPLIRHSINFFSP